MAKGVLYVEETSMRDLPWHSKTPESKIRKTAKVKGKLLLGDVVCKTPTMVTTLVVGRVCNGWRMWCDKEGGDNRKV